MNTTNTEKTWCNYTNSEGNIICGGYVNLKNPTTDGTSNLDSIKYTELVDKGKLLKIPDFKKQMEEDRDLFIK